MTTYETKVSKTDDGRNYYVHFRYEGNQVYSYKPSRFPEHPDLGFKIKGEVTIH